MISVLLLGPLEVRVDDARVPLGGVRQRSLSALLAMRAREVVSRDWLVETMWEGRPPRSADHAVQEYASRLRRALGSESARLRTVGSGYALHLEEHEVDVSRAERGLAQGREALLRGDPTQASDALGRALTLWRGDPLADLRDAAFAAEPCRRFEELRLDLLVERIEADLAVGRHADVIPELESVVRSHPLRERPRRQLMLALYRSGRQADALAAYRDARRALVAELGIEPSPEMRELQAAILGQDPSLALRSRPRPVRQLPSPPTPLVGRTRQVEEVAALLREESRLVTLTGPGGIGKTRLAIRTAGEIADEFPDGVVFVGLESLRQIDEVPDLIRTTLGLTEAGAAPEQAVGEHLRDRAMLLVLDNFEQVDDAAPYLGELLAVARNLKLLVTSRHRLRIYGEHVYPVPPLRLADEAVPLFLARARAAAASVEPSPAVAALCAAVDCLPLAIELVAARADDVLAEQRAGLLASHLPLAGPGPRDVAERQQTLSAAIAWSHDLLSADARHRFEDLSVFAGGWDLQAATAVCGATAADVESLVVRNLVHAEGSRFAMLGTIRQFAAERLARSGRSDRLRERHLAYFVALAENADVVLRQGGETARTLTLLETEHANLTAALDWSASTGRAATTLGLATTLGYFWEWRGHVREGLRHLRTALDTATDVDSRVRTRALMRAGVFAQMQADLATAGRLIHEALELARSDGDNAQVANALRNLGALAMGEDDLSRAHALHDEAHRISQSRGDALGVSSSLINLADVALARGDFPAAERLSRESITLARQLSHEVREVVSGLNLGLALLHLGRADEATATFAEALQVCRRLAYREGVAICAVGLAALASAHAEPVAAAVLLGAAEAQLEEAGAVLEPGEARLQQQVVDRLDERLGGERTEEAWARGRRLTFEAAVDEGLAVAEAMRSAEPRAR